MKIILAILCALAAVAALACAIMLIEAGATGTSGAVALALAPAIVLVLNAMVLGTMFGWGKPHRAPFYILAALDLVGAALAAKFWSAISFQVGDIWTMAAPAIAVLLVKAVLGVMVARRLPQG